MSVIPASVTAELIIDDRSKRVTLSALVHSATPPASANVLSVALNSDLPVDR